LAEKNVLDTFKGKFTKGMVAAFVIHLIESKKEYKDLPEPQGGYM
jgi:hypothetical protein